MKGQKKRTAQIPANCMSRLSPAI